MGKGLEKRAFKTHVERALFCNLNYSHCFQGGRHRQLGSITPESDLKVCLIADRSGKWPSVQSNPCAWPCKEGNHHPEALLWLHQKLVSQRKAEAWRTNRMDKRPYWLLIGLGFLLLIWNRTLLCVSPWVDYHSEMFLLLCLPLHSSYFLESPTVISLNMKTAYFCLIVLLICKIPSSSERQDDYCECMESFYHEKRVHWFTYYTYQPATW